MRGKDLEERMVIGNRRVLKVIARGRWVLYSYEYLVDDDRRGIRWYRQGVPPVGRIAANANLPPPSPVAP